MAMAARMPMIATTIMSSIRVKPRCPPRVGSRFRQNPIIQFLLASFDRTVSTLDAILRAGCRFDASGPTGSLVPLESGTPAKSSRRRTDPAGRQRTMRDDGAAKDCQPPRGGDSHPNSMGTDFDRDGVAVQ